MHKLIDIFCIVINATIKGKGKINKQCLDTRR